jgi:hypothetical protein
MVTYTNRDWINELAVHLRWLSGQGKNYVATWDGKVIHGDFLVGTNRVLPSVPLSVPTFTSGSNFLIESRPIGDEVYAFIKFSPDSGFLCSFQVKVPTGPIHIGQKFGFMEIDPK